MIQPANTQCLGVLFLPSEVRSLQCGTLGVQKGTIPKGPSTYMAGLHIMAHDFGPMYVRKISAKAVSNYGRLIRDSVSKLYRGCKVGPSVVSSEVTLQPAHY